MSCIVRLCRKRRRYAAHAAHAAHQHAPTAVPVKQDPSDGSRSVFEDVQYYGFSCNEGINRQGRRSSRLSTVWAGGLSLTGVGQAATAGLRVLPRMACAGFRHGRTRVQPPHGLVTLSARLPCTTTTTTPGIFRALLPFSFPSLSSCLPVITRRAVMRVTLPHPLPPT
jgi:hypothetical protein